MTEKAEPKQKAEPKPEIVRYENLIIANVQVVDKAGNKYYLEPSHRQGEFILRVLPK